MFNLFRLFYGEERDDLLGQAMQDTEEMFRKSRIMFEAATNSVFDNEKMPFNIFEKDKELNEMLKRIRRKMLIHHSDRKTPKEDFIISFIILIITVDIERIGDYAKNIAEQSRFYSQRLEGKHIDSLRKIRKEILKIFDVCSQALEELDEIKARTVMENKESIKNRCEEIFDFLAEGKKSDSAETKTIALLARFLKRTACHIGNVASSITNPLDQIGFRPEQKE